MSLPVPPWTETLITVRARSRELRHQSREALERSARLRRRANELFAVPDLHQLRAEVLRSRAREAHALREQLRRDADQAHEDAAVDAWCRERVAEMLDAGWTRAELADVGVTDALLRQLGLPVPS